MKSEDIKCSAIEWHDDKITWLSSDWLLPLTLIILLISSHNQPSLPQSFLTQYQSVCLLVHVTAGRVWSRYLWVWRVLLSSNHLPGSFFLDFYLLVSNQQLKDRVHFPFYCCVLLKLEISPACWSDSSDKVVSQDHRGTSKIVRQWSPGVPQSTRQIVAQLRFDLWHDLVNI